MSKKILSTFCLKIYVYFYQSPNEKVVRRSKRSEKSYVKIVQIGDERKLIVSDEELNESTLALKNLKIG